MHIQRVINSKSKYQMLKWFKHGDSGPKCWVSDDVSSSWFPIHGLKQIQYGAISLDNLTVVGC